jgi:dihydrofolate reductase
MRKLIVFTNLSLDGVIQAPGRADEDLRDGFQHGGWGLPYAAMANPAARQSVPETGALLFGRRTYEDFYLYWPHQVGSPYTEQLNNASKYVASTTLNEPLPWVNSTLLKGDAAITVAALKAQPGPNILVMGSGVLVQTLMHQGLVDLYVLLIHPLILGSGRRLFPQGSPKIPLRLVDLQKTDLGVVVASYTHVT